MKLEMSFKILLAVSSLAGNTQPKIPETKKDIYSPIFQGIWRKFQVLVQWLKEVIKVQALSIFSSCCPHQNDDVPLMVARQPKYLQGITSPHREFLLPYTSIILDWITFFSRRSHSPQETSLKMWLARSGHIPMLQRTHTKQSLDVSTCISGSECWWVKRNGE